MGGKRRDAICYMLYAIRPISIFAVLVVSSVVHNTHDLTEKFVFNLYLQLVLTRLNALVNGRPTRDKP